MRIFINTYGKRTQRKTGKDLNHWKSIVKYSGLIKHKEILDYLKANHGFTYGFANFVAHKSNESNAVSIEEDLTDLQYNGKEQLRPIHDQLLEEITK